MTWAVIHADGSVCLDGHDDEDAAWAVVHYFDSMAATGAPMKCSPHFVAPESGPPGTEDAK